MAHLDLKVSKRDTTSQTAKSLRNKGFVPGIFYGQGFENIPIVSDLLTLRPVIYTKFTNIISLEIEGSPEKHECVLQDVTFDPVTDKITHFDLIGLIPGAHMTFEVPITLSGQAIGVREGGLLQQNIHKVKVKCLPRDLPQNLVVNVSDLGVGHSVYIKDVKLDNVVFEAPDDTVIVSVGHSRVTASTKTAETK